MKPNKEIYMITTGGKIVKLKEKTVVNMVEDLAKNATYVFYHPDNMAVTIWRTLKESLLMSNINLISRNRLEYLITCELEERGFEFDE
jgi:hypothetical protein